MSNDNLKKVQNIISKILYLTLATSSKKGEPWNTPLYFAFDNHYNFFWVSDKNAQHSKNIDENNEVFFVIYNSTATEGTGEGVYIQAKAYKLNEEAEMTYALTYLDGRVNHEETKITEFLDDKPRGLYKAVPEKVWINGDGDINGDYIDIRIEVDLRDNKKLSSKKDILKK